MASANHSPLRRLWDKRVYAVAVAGALVALVGVSSLAAGGSDWAWFPVVGGFVLVLTVLLSRRRMSDRSEDSTGN